ncbi:hypothetical protein F511_05180 [Dorcoceras hygrometricum]|uniref:AIPP2-like SPOC-like domain-containing protein n=1 Tax=Dorcoceras hygrometricum TaxID=472368 RepID=A0A2Z7C1Z6_9LAMI|nr:hypothetical protein F511_05180 [Dorcoceras hygrometricum]
MSSLSSGETMLVIPQTKGFSCSDKNEDVDYRSKSGTCNVCSAPCSSCYHDNQILMKSAVESAGETCAERSIVDWGKRRQTEQLSEMSIIETINSSADSSEIALRKAFSRTSDTSASNDAVVLANFEAQRVLAGYDDCLSCETRIDDATKMLNFTSENAHMMNPPCSSVSTVHLNLSQIPASKGTDAPSDLLMARDRSSVNSLLCGSNSRGIDADKSSIPHLESLEGSKEHLDSSLVGPVVTDVSRDVPATTAVSSANNDDMRAAIHPRDEAEDSDIVEQDVKVCDICGDAGREDLLAICCRCSDGAEHTYCMREMLAKVPEGDWLCEECKSSEVRYQRREKLGRLDENEKNYSGQASSERMNSSDVEGNRTRGCLNISTKRPRDDVDTEVSSVMKKLAVDSTVGTPMPSRSDKAAALSRENSSKNLEKGKVLSSHGIPTSDAVTVSNTPELARPGSDQRSPNFRGTLSKSNSLTFQNLKPKVKLVDQVQRDKSASELASLRFQSGTVRPIGRSLSFKSTNSIYPESKTKMLSPRLSNILEGKNTKNRGSLRSEDGSINLVMPTSMRLSSRGDKKIASRAETCSLSVHPEIKPVQLGKSVPLSRSSSIASRRSADLTGSVGEFKKPSIYGLNTPRVSSASEINNFDEKSSHTSPKEDSSSCSGVSCSGVSETPNLNAIECLPGGFARLGELTNSAEPSGEDSGSHFRTSHVKSFRNENNNLKAAIEAAVRRKPIGYKRHRYDEPSALSKGGDFPSKDHLSSSTRIEISVAEAAERHIVSQNLTADCHGTPNPFDNFSSVAAEAISSGREEVPSVRLDVKSFSSDVYRNVVSPRTLKSFAIPEHEYIWQGSFEIYQNDKVFTVWDGIQAHRSTCASSEVLESVIKFKSKIVLNEVPRLSTWPVQFQEHGVEEDDIALFFLLKILRVWLENMMKNDLAFKGSLDGVELLIFPSNQLPENFQRWNMLFFLWGVFRAKKGSCLPNMPDTLKQFFAPQNVPPSIIPVPGDRYMLRPVSKDLLATDDKSSEPKVHASESLCDTMLTEAVNGDCGSKVSSSDGLDGWQNSSCSTALSGARATCQKPTDTCLEGGANPICRPLQSTLSSVISQSQPPLMQLDTLVPKEQSSHPSYKPSDCILDTPPEGGIGETPTILDRMTCNPDQVKLRMVGEDLSSCAKAPMEDDQGTRGLNTEVNRLLLNHYEYLRPRSTCMETRAPNACTSHVLAENDDNHCLPRRALGKMNRVDLENRDYEVCDETVICGHSENAERRFFPMELQLVDISMPRKLNTVEQDQPHDRAPNLELALGAERKSSISDIQLSMIRNPERKVAKEYIHDRRLIIADEDDEELASLSLSLSFPFPKEEKTTKSVLKTEQLVSDKDHVTTSFPLFRDFEDK